MPKCVRMYERWDAKRVRERTLQLLDEQLFCDLYETLRAISAEFGEPSPAELWDEAAARWKPLLGSKRPLMFVGMLREELTEQYGERSAFLVLMVLMYMLVSMFRPTDADNPFRPYCEALAAATEGHPLLARLWEGIRQSEDDEERAGRCIGIVASLLTEMGAPAEAIALDTIEKCILRLPTFELRQKALSQADDLLRGTPWSQRSAVVQERMFALEHERSERQHQMEDSLRWAAEKPAVQIDVKPGAHAQITEQGITNQFRELPNKQEI